MGKILFLSFSVDIHILPYIRWIKYGHKFLIVNTELKKKKPTPDLILLLFLQGYIFFSQLLHPGLDIETQSTIHFTYFYTETREPIMFL